jgi:menaquinol-cytochrome c reductase iron-sulfur subunit
MADHAQAYQDPGTPEEQSRRQFLANATLAIGGVIGLVVTVPVAASLIPESLIKPNAAGGPVWAPLSAAELKSLESSTDTPVKINIEFKFQDGYLPPADDQQFVWGVKLTPAQAASFQKTRPDLFKPTSKVAYDAVTMNFVLFSSICPHLGCKYNWDVGAKRFICPCHNSQFTIEGQKISGPAPRGLDPLPFRDKDGKAAVTWIQYKSQTPDRIIVAYS